MAKLKVLCFHGYRQNVAAFKVKSGGFRKLLKNCEFEYIEAPHIIPEGEQNPDGSPDCLSWWFSSPNPDYFKSTQTSDYVKGFDESIDAITKFVNEKGPFDGVLGFSQGGSMVALLCALKHLGELRFDFKFAILIASFKSLTSSHVQLFDRVLKSLSSSSQTTPPPVDSNISPSDPTDIGRIRIPTLHLCGTDDQVVVHSVSQQFAMNYFFEPTVVLHSKGHCIPSDSSLRPAYEQFFKSIHL